MWPVDDRGGGGDFCSTTPRLDNSILGGMEFRGLARPVRFIDVKASHGEFMIMISNWLIS